GHVLFLLPMAGLILWTSVPFAALSFTQREGSSNFGGLPQWPLKALVPIAFGLLFLQGLSELIKRIAILRGDMA
ncbi:TRAP transporter small permease subunit, partial [Vibrio parahaemolyticus]